MKSLFLLTLLVSATTKADMYYECTKVNESEPVNSILSAPKAVELTEAGQWDLYLDGKKVKNFSVNDKNYYKPVVTSEYLFLGEMVRVEYFFKGEVDCQEAKMKRIAHIGSEEIIETAYYQCKCGED